jgi:LytS/YehU family sensor histidine kinase
MATTDPSNDNSRTDAPDPASMRDAAEQRPAVARPVLAMTIGLWGLNFAMITGSGAIAGFEHQWLRLGLRTGLTVFGIGLCYGIHRLIMLAPARPFRRRAWLTIGLTFCAALIHLLANEAALRLTGIITLPVTRDVIGLNVIFFGFWVWFFLAWAALHLAIDYGDQVRRQSDAHARIVIAAREAQIRALRYQINPHFLFNTLNSLSTLVLDKRAAESGQMIDRLSAFLRTVLEDDPADETTLAIEIANQRLYLEIEQARFPDLAVEFDIEPGVERALVPSFLLQPLVENAVKYGRPAAGRRSSLRIKAQSRWERLEIAVINDVPEVARSHGTGLGLSNVRERLRLRYGKDFSFSAGPAAAGTFEVRLSLPFKLRI